MPLVVVKIRSSFWDPVPLVLWKPYRSALPKPAWAAADRSYISTTPASILSELVITPVKTELPIYPMYPPMY